MFGAQSDGSRWTQSAAARTLLTALAAFALWRGSLLVFDYVGLYLMPRAGPCKPPDEVFGRGKDFWNAWFWWDGGWYRNIIKNGYTFRTNMASTVAFYPLFPYLARWLGVVFGSPLVAGLVITHLGTLSGIYFLYRLGDHLWDRETSERAVVLQLVFPTSFFLSAFYTEGLFLGLATASMYFFYRERYVESGLLGGFAMLARSSGMVLFAAFAAELLWKLLKKQARFRWTMLGLLLVPAGLGVFMWMLKSQVGDPFAFAKASHFWGRRPSMPWTPLIDALSKIEGGGLPRRFEDAQQVLDAFIALGFLGIGTAMAVRRYPVALWAFVLLGVLIPLTTYNLASMGRYVLVLFPVFFFLSRLCLGKPKLERFFVYSSAFFLALYGLRFMRCGWAG